MHANPKLERCIHVLHTLVNIRYGPRERANSLDEKYKKLGLSPKACDSAVLAFKSENELTRTSGDVGMLCEVVA